MQRDLEGKVAIVTGANTGIGEVTAAELARRGARVYLACRSEEKTRPVLEKLRAESGERSAEFLALDLASLESVRSAAEKFLATKEPLHLLIDNAGLAGQKGLTKEGFELTFGVNHIGHFLFTNLLLQRLIESAPARIVIVSSRAHRRPKTLTFDKVRELTKLPGMREYGQSKLANVVFARSLAKRLLGSGVTTYSLHPGVVASDIWRKVPIPFRWLMKLFMVSTEEGARTTLYCATEPGIAKESGRYYSSSKQASMNPAAEDEALGERLWHESERWTGLAR